MTSSRFEIPPVHRLITISFLGMEALLTEATVWDWSDSLPGFASSILLEIAACILVTCTVASLRR